jgi:hypothetical protein
VLLLLFAFRQGEEKLIIFLKRIILKKNKYREAMMMMMIYLSMSICAVCFPPG